MNTSLFSNHEVLYIISEHEYKPLEVYDNTMFNSAFDIYHGLIIKSVDYLNRHQRLHFRYKDWLNRKKGQSFKLPVRKVHAKLNIKFKY
jgi:hypothetical protein